MKEIVFDSSKFKLKYVLGSGSFGVVTCAEYTNEATQGVTSYALKSLSKAAVVETGEKLKRLYVLEITCAYEHAQMRTFVLTHLVPLTFIDQIFIRYLNLLPVFSQVNYDMSWTNGNCWVQWTADLLSDYSVIITQLHMLLICVITISYTISSTIFLILSKLTRTWSIERYTICFHVHPSIIWYRIAQCNMM